MASLARLTALPFAPVAVCALCAGLLIPATALAEGDAPALVTASAALPSAVDDGAMEEPAPRITITRAADLVGNPVRPILSGEGGAGAVNGLPFASSAISSGFGNRYHPILRRWQRHGGVDFAAPAGTSVPATGGGRVVSAGWAGNYGYAVTVDHGGGLRTRYAHLSRIDVAVGQQVEEGSAIGAVGSTGLSTGPHLHYEVQRNGQAIDPLR